MPESLFIRPDFLPSSNIYEVNIRQYSAEGSFSAFTEQIPRLRDMGVEILWLMPIHPIGTEKRKGTLGSYYSISDHKGVNPEFGKEDDLRALITKAHANGMKVILDWVANHTAWDHIWTKTNPDFFMRDEQENFLTPPGWDDVIQINHENKEEQSAMMESMEYWIRAFDIDGFRADLAHLTPLQFWKDARLKLSPLKKDLIWLAESEDRNYLEAFDICFTWEWMHATEKFSKKEISLEQCIDVLKASTANLPQQALQLFFTSNHDENSWNGTEYEKYGSNAKAFAVFSCLYSGLSLIYSGQENPNIKRLKFFDKDLIEPAGKYELHDLYKKLFELRKNNSSLFSKRPAVVQFQENVFSNNVLAYLYSDEASAIIVMLNLNDADVSQELNFETAEANYRNVFTNETFVFKGNYIFNAAPGAFSVLEKIRK